MTGVRENILANSSVRDRFLDACVALDQPNAGVTAADLFDFLRNNNLPVTMRGVQQDLSVWDIFVFWHLLAMRIPLAVGNAAHSGPIFLPWHRMYMIRLEEFMQNALGDDQFGLPYWDWSADGELPATQQWRADIWSSAYIGEGRGAVRSGPIGQMRVRLAQDPMTGDLVSVPPRPIQRRAGLDPRTRTLPTQADVGWALSQTRYDEAAWGQNVRAHRNVLEGWINGPQLHNRVHVWIGGDMGPGTSPNDPAFFLNHCFVDRVWQDWMNRNGPFYAPGPGRGPAGHRIDSRMVAIIGDALTPGDVLDPASWYVYDNQMIA